MKGWAVALLMLLALPAAAAPATIRNVEDWRSLLAAHAGQPVAIHFWGVTCGPCRTELPKWGALLGERPDLALILIEADPVPFTPDQVRSLLDKAGLSRAESLILADSGERLRYGIDPDWLGELPMTLLIDRNGKRVRILGEADFATVRQWLRDATAGRP